MVAVCQGLVHTKKKHEDKNMRHLRHVERCQLLCARRCVQDLTSGLGSGSGVARFSSHEVLARFSSHEAPHAF